MTKNRKEDMTVAELRREIRAVLKEADVGMPGYGADIGPLGPGYGFFNYGGSLKNIFVDPFVDVFKTAKGVATELTARAKSAAQVAIEVILSSFIPLYETNYTAIFKQMDKSLEGIKKKYEKVYQANNEAFADKDARFLAFLYDPSAWITTKTVGNSPAAAANILQIFTDSRSGAGTHLIEAIRFLNELQREIKGVSRYNRHTAHRLRRSAASMSRTSSLDVAPWESVERDSGAILEAGDQAQMTMEQRIQQILSNPELKKEIAQSPIAQQMRKDGQAILGTLTGQLSKDIAESKSIKSLEDIVRMSHGKVQMPKIDVQNPQEKQQVEQAAVSSVRQSLSEFYRRSLQGAIKQVQDEGVAPDNAYLRTLQGLLSKVGS